MLNLFSKEVPLTDMVGGPKEPRTPQKATGMQSPFGGDLFSAPRYQIGVDPLSLRPPVHNNLFLSLRKEGPDSRAMEGSLFFPPAGRGPLMDFSSGGVAFDQEPLLMQTLVRKNHY